MPANNFKMPNVQYPTGYEGEQRKIEAKRRIAQAMLEMGITPDNRMTSWTQVAAKLGQAFAGKRMEKKATEREGAMYDKMRSDLAEKMARFQQMRDSGATNQQLADTFSGDPMMADMIDPHRDALASALKNREEIFDTGGAQGFQRKGDFVGKPLPFDPNKPVMIDPQTGAPTVNPVRATAAMAAQGLVSPVPGDQPGMITPVYSMQSGGGQLSSGPAGGSMPPSASAPAQGGMDFSRFKPEEMQVLQQEISRRAGLDPQAQNFPQGNPLSPPPSKVGPDGRPYWSIGGKWYDNPEGR